MKRRILLIMSCFILHYIEILEYEISKMPQLLFKTNFQPSRDLLNLYLRYEMSQNSTGLFYTKRMIIS